MGKEIYHVLETEEFKDPYIDIEEDRERILPDGTSISFHYVHGGFTEKAVKFSFCIPMEELYENRFFQILSPFPGPDEEMASLQLTGDDDWVGFALKYHCGFVESNMGSKNFFGPKEDDTLVWRSSAAVAEYYRTYVMNRFGVSRPYGYVFGGSGGGYKTMACIENTDAFDGAVPFVIGSPVSLPNTITMHAQGQRALRDCFEKIIDNLDAGGSGNMYDGLNEDEAAMLKELTLMGFPPKAWFFEAWGVINDGSLSVLAPGVKRADPDYFEEFWTKPGYLGADPESQTARDRVQFSAKVTRVHIPTEHKEENPFDSRNDVDNAWQKMLTDAAGSWIEVDHLPAKQMVKNADGVFEEREIYTGGMMIQLKDGKAAGQSLSLKEMIRQPDSDKGLLVIGPVYGPVKIEDILGSIAGGDEVYLDNSDYIAIQSYYRHQVPKDLTFHAWDQFRDENGDPTLPQRANVMGYGFTGTGTVQDGNIQCKTIVMQSLMDESTCPWCGVWYHDRVVDSKGSDKDFRIYYSERCMHGPIAALENSQCTNYGGALRQALLDVSRWVEEGVEPLPSSNYTLQKDGQVTIPDDPKERRGMQCCIDFGAAAEGEENYKDCVRVKVGQPVHFHTKAVVPKDAGYITAIDYQFEDERKLICEHLYEYKTEVTKTERNGLHGGESDITHVYQEPGTHFASVRVMSQRKGDASENFTQVRNIARVRVIVE